MFGLETIGNATLIVHDGIRVMCLPDYNQDATLLRLRRLLPSSPPTRSLARERP